MMKKLSCIFPILFCFLCVLCLFLAPFSENGFTKPERAFAKETEAHNTLSSALSINLQTAYRETVAAYDCAYYYAVSQKRISFSVRSDTLSSLKISLLSDDGDSLSLQPTIEKDTCFLTPSTQEIKNSARLFVCIKNQSAHSCSYTLQADLTNTDAQTQTAAPQPSATPKATKTPSKKSVTATPKPSKKSASSKTTLTPKTTPTPKAALSQATLPSPSAAPPITDSPTPTSTGSAKASSAAPSPTVSKNDSGYAISLSPQIVVLSPDSKQTLSIQSEETGNDAGQFHWFSTDTDTASVENGVITAHEAGIAVVWAMDTSASANTSACFVRVITAYENE